MSSKVAGRGRNKGAGDSDPVETDSPAKKQRTLKSNDNNKDYDPDFAKDEGSQEKQTTKSSRSEAGKRAAETRRRNAANKSSQSQEEDDQSTEGDQSNKQSSKHNQGGTHEQHVEAGKKGAEARWGKGSGDDSSSGSKGKDEAKKVMDELAKDEQIQSLKEKQNAEREQEIKECQLLLQQAMKQSAKPDLALMMKPQGKNLIQVIRMEHRLVEQLGEQLTALLQKSGDDLNDQAMGMAFNIMKLLSIHAACEEMVLYPMMKAKGHDALVKHALEEHTEMKSDLEQLNEIFDNPDRKEFMNKLQKCLEDTLHHVEEEEECLLPLVESINNQAELDKMLVQFLEGHMKSPTRPHLDAPAEPPANIKANAEAAQLDMKMDIDEGRFEVPAM